MGNARQGFGEEMITLCKVHMGGGSFCLVNPEHVVAIIPYLGRGEIKSRIILVASSLQGEEDVYSSDDPSVLCRLFCEEVPRGI